MVMLGLLSMAGLAFGSSLKLGANNLAGLRGVEIRPYGDFSIDAGDSLLLTLEGDYMTYSVPMRGAWRILDGDDLGWLVGTCDAKKSCEFQAGDRSGEVTILANANGFSNEATIYIQEKKNTQARPVENPFTDAIPDWAGNPIVALQKKQILRGYDDGRFGAADTLTRGQLVTIFYRALTHANLIAPINCQQVYKDVPTGHYAFAAACVFRDRGWTDSLSTLSPDEPVSRGETASLLNRVLGSALLKAEDKSLGEVLASSQIFSDVPPHHIYFGDTAVTRTLGIMKGNPTGAFGVSDTLNRAEAATVFYRVLEKIDEASVRGL